MFRKKAQQKKIREEIFKEMESSKTAIGQLVDDYQEYEIFNAEKIGREVNFNYPRVYLYMLCNYGEDICQLVNAKRYGSLYVLLNNFLECYGMTKELVEGYFNKETDYDGMLRKYYASTLKQRMDECDGFDPEYALSEADEEKFYNIRFEQMEKIVGEFFKEYKDKLHNEDGDYQLHGVVDEICSNAGLPLDREDKALRALASNDEFTEEEMKKAVLLYVSARSASLNNIQTMLTRVLGVFEGRAALMINKNEGISPQVLSIVEKCLRDVINTAKEGFECLPDIE
ncbi:MAG: hypothetical protein U0K95_06105 [Eubacterium sp.]|nr:hypothetical protein [Eubacterium sp.]